MSPARSRRLPSPLRPAHRAFHARALAVAALLGGCALPSAQAATCTWNTTSGNWNALANWINCVTGNGNPTGVPGAADTANIGAAGVVAVTNAQAVNALLNAGTINIASGGSLLLNAGGGGTTNSGTVNVASGGALSLDGRSFAHAIGGGGSFVLAGGTLRLEGANTTTLAAGNAIRGAGTVGNAVLLGGSMNFVNNGSIVADANATTLNLNAPGNSGSYTNNGLFEARDGGTLQLNANVTQGAGGVMQALNGSRVQLSGVTVTGGTLQTGGTGAIGATNTSANLLRNVTLAGVVDLASAASQLRVGDGLALSGGTINVGNSTLYFDNRSNAGLAVDQTLSGTGAITVAGGNIRFETATPAQTTLASGVSISGHGNIGQASIQGGQHTLVNNGLISANSSGNTLVLQPISNGGQPVQNNGILEATGGGTLRLDTGVVGGAGSQLRANAGSTIRMNGVTVSGVVNTTGGGTVTASNTSANLLRNVTLDGVIDLGVAAAQLRVGDSLVLQNNASINVGASTLYFDNRSNAGLATTQTIGGNGSITVAGGNIRFETANPAQTTLASGVSISGHGNIGQASIQGGQHTFINNGLISANSSGNTLVLQPISNGGQPVQNNGILEATGGGTLRLDTGVVGAPGSQLRANAGSTIRMNGVTVSGVVNTTGGGTVTASNNSANLLRNVTLDGVIDLGVAAAQLRVGDSLVLQNNASINVGASTLYLDNRSNAGLSPTQTLSGNGSISLAGGNLRLEASNLGSTTLEAGVTVAGYGTFGQAALQGGNLSFVNQSTISANVNAQTLQLLRPANIGSFSNESLLEARNGGVLLLSTDISQTASGNLQALDGSTVRISNSTVAGGTLSSSGSGAIRATNTNNNLLSNVTLAGVVDLASAASQLRIGNGLAFSGGTINVGGSTLYLDNRSNAGLSPTQTLSGNGSISLAGGAIRMEGGAGTQQTTLGSGVTISGHGTIGAAVLQGGNYALVNNGTIAASTAGQTLTLQPFANGNGTLSGTGRLQVAGGTLAMTLGQASTQGVLDIGSSGTFAMNAQNLTLNTDYINAQWGSGNGFNRRAGVTGAGQILAGGDAVMVFTGDGISGGNSGNATLTIGNVRVGSSTFNYQLANAGSSGPTLRGAIQTSVNGGNLTDGRLSGVGVTAANFSAGAPGGSSGDLGIVFTVGQAGPLAPLTGQVLNFRSNFDNLADQRLNIVLGAGAAAYQAAVGLAAPDPIVLAAQRVGGLAVQALNISNLPPPDAPSAFSEDLNASFGAFSGAALGSGSVAGLLAGGSNGSAMTVGLNTAIAGALTGSVVVQFETAGTVAGVSNGLGVAPVGSQTIAVSGNVYAPAVAVLNTPNVDFGIVRVGDTVVPQTVSVGNNASGALTDTLRASLTGGAAPFTAAGTASGIAAGSSDASALTVTLNTATAGVYSGSGLLSFTSQNPEMADLPLGSTTVGFSAQVNNLAASALAHSGAGSFSGGLQSYILNFGTVVEGQPGGTATLSLANIALGPADALAGSFDLSELMPGDPFALSGFGSFSGLEAGSSLGGLTISFGGTVQGSFDRVITLNTLSTNASGPDLALGAVELRLLGTVAAIPEPGTWAMWLAGLAVLGQLLRRRAREQAAA
jgi:hypothetical protein